jgi:hypothetical protein
MNGGVGPTISGFQTFITNVMMPPDTFDPSTDPSVPYAYNFAYQWVYGNLCSVQGLPGAWNMYALAVYGLAADTLILFAQDAPDAPVYKDGLAYWAWIRKQYNVLAFFPGVVQSSSDEGTSTTYMVPHGFENFTVMNLQNLKTPYGRFYIGIAQSWGPLWELS